MELGGEHKDSAVNAARWRDVGPSRRRAESALSGSRTCPYSSYGEGDGARLEVPDNSSRRRSLAWRKKRCRYPRVPRSFPEAIRPATSPAAWKLWLVPKRDVACRSRSAGIGYVSSIVRSSPPGKRSGGGLATASLALTTNLASRPRRDGRHPASVLVRRSKQGPRRKVGSVSGESPER